MCSVISDPRFPDYGKVELVFSEGPEKIPGTDFSLLKVFTERDSLGESLETFICVLPPSAPW